MDANYHDLVAYIIYQGSIDSRLAYIIRTQCSPSDKYMDTSDVSVPTHLQPSVSANSFCCVYNHPEDVATFMVVCQ